MRWIAVLVAVLAAAFAFAPAAQAQPDLTVRVTIDTVEAKDGFEGGGDADFDSNVGFDGNEGPRQGPINDDDTADPNPDWIFGRSVDSAKGRAAISIEVRDKDGGLRLDDDHADIDPTNGGDPFNLELEVNLAVCGSQSVFPNTNPVSGDGNVKCGQFVESTGTANNNKAKIRYMVEVFDGDVDNDFLPNSWEEPGSTRTTTGRRSAAAEPGRPFRPQGRLRRGRLPRRCQPLALPDRGRTDRRGTGVLQLAGRQQHRDAAASGRRQSVWQFHFGDPNVSPLNGMEGRIGNMGGGGTQIPEAGKTIIDWDGATGSPSRELLHLEEQPISTPASQNVRRAVFRYAIFGHQTNNRVAVNDCTSGWAEGIPGNDFMVTLGGRRDLNTPPDGTTETTCWGETATDSIDNDGDGATERIENTERRHSPEKHDGEGWNGVDEDGGDSLGNRQEQAGTFMHELGHALGLQHGGGDSLNAKPNYLSVMNYAFQAVQRSGHARRRHDPHPGGCDYSRIVVNLDERLPPAGAGLDECFGPGPGSVSVATTGTGTLRRCSRASRARRRTTTTFRPTSITTAIRIPTTTAYSTRGRLRSSPTSLASTTGTASSTTSEALTNFATGTANDPVANEPDPRTIENAQAYLADLLAPDIKVTVSGPTTARPGESLSYTIRTANDGDGPAFGVGLAATRPDGSTTSFNLGDLIVGRDASRTITHSVPSNACRKP